MDVAEPLVALSVLALLAGCGTDSQTAPVDDGPVGIPTDHTDPAALLEAWETALQAKDLDVFAALLEPDPGGRGESGFRYFPQTEDLIDFPWMQGADFWSRADELAIMGNMFDPEFVSSETGETIDTIQASVTATAQDDLGDGSFEVTSTALFTVLWAPQTGATSDVRLIHLLVPDGNGFLRIREQRELPLTGLRVENESWGRIKAAYRL